MRLAFSAFCVVLAFTQSCGYVGPVVPPSPEIPIPVTNLTAVERGNEIQVNFTTPALTTDLLQVKKLSDVELRAGPAVTPFDAAKWEVTSKRYDLQIPSMNTEDPQPVPLNVNIPVSDWLGKKIAVSVRTSVRGGNRFSSWSAPVDLDVIAPLQPPRVGAEATRDGYKLRWAEERPGVRYEILRQAHGQATPESVGTAEKSEFTDSTSQWDVPYTYFVVAKKDGAESLRSDGVTVNHPDTFPPSVPAGVTALAGPESVELTWSRSPEADLKSYRIYRALGSGPLGPVGEPTNLPTFSDRKVEHGKTYRYAVSAIDVKNNESEKSPVVEVAF
ncbi:MAG: fibronectin type III domain-containing protein [Bryobacteraceae bacterium]